MAACKGRHHTDCNQVVKSYLIVELIAVHAINREELKKVDKQ